MTSRKRIIVLAHCGVYAACVLFATIIPSPVFSKSTDINDDIFSQPTGLWLIPDGANNNRKLYGATSPAANWNVGQWDIPEELPPFKNNHSENEFASVTFSNSKISLSQNGSHLPCTKLFQSGRQLVDEFDLLFAPTTKVYPLYPQAFLGRRSLQSLKAITLTSTILPTSVQLKDSQCPITWASAGIGVVLTDTSTRQTLFYQLNFVRYTAAHDHLTLALLPPGWFSTGESIQSGQLLQYGYGDRLWSSFGKPPIALDVHTTLRLDLLPRIKQVIMEGARYGMDKDIRNWAVTAGYFGQSVFGHVLFSTTWNSFALKVDILREP